MVYYELKPETKLTEEQEKMLTDAAKLPVVFDEDSPELTDEELAQFYRVSERRREERRKQTVTIRLSPQALDIAKSLGKGYTSVLSRILESALRNKEVIQRYL
ncbi:MAG: BrnA antitoxin family protein [Clostridiales bacterium]|nr:BrnA antitoxin family protein [Clostridiales bacterium]